MVDQIIVFTTLAVALGLFVHGGIRYDVVSLLALFVVVIAGITPAAEAFEGFGHPAVITVAAVLIISRGLSNAGVVDHIAKFLERLGSNMMVQMMALTALVIVASAFMNNVGALALLMPVAIKIARLNNQQPSTLLMPLAFGSLLGGQITLIGTPPNLIIASFREEATGVAFGMFDFAPVGAAMSVAGLAFILLVGWRLIPRRESAEGGDMFQIEAYLTEVRVTEKSVQNGKSLNETGLHHDRDIVVVGLERGDSLKGVPSGDEILHAGDVLVVEAHSKDLDKFVLDAGLELVGSKNIYDRVFGDEDGLQGAGAGGAEGGHSKDPAFLHTARMDLMEAVVRERSAMTRRSVRQLDLRNRYGINLLAISRQGVSLGSLHRLKTTPLRAGDVLLLQGARNNMLTALPKLGAVPLAEREIKLAKPTGTLLAVGIFAAAIVITSLGLLSSAVAFSIAAVAMVLTNIMSLRQAYESIEMPIVILLAAMIPVGAAMQSTGGADLIAQGVLNVTGALAPWIIMAVLMTVTMLLSNVINNAAAAVLMAPIAIGIAHGLNVSIDPLLMTVCVGSSAPFLTPIGHQSNTLVMGPGGYRFGDYWKLGAPLSVLVVVVAVPVILMVWPLALP